MSQARQVFDTNRIDENSDQDQARVFRTSKKLVMRTDELSFPDCLDQLILANDINMTFAGIRVDIKPTDVDDAVPIIDVEVGDDHRCLFLGAFHPLSESDVCTLMRQ